MAWLCRRVAVGFVFVWLACGASGDEPVSDAEAPGGDRDGGTRTPEDGGAPVPASDAAVGTGGQAGSIGAIADAAVQMDTSPDTQHPADMAQPMKGGQGGTPPVADAAPDVSPDAPWITPPAGDPPTLAVTGASNAPLVGFKDGAFLDTCPAAQVIIGWDGSYTQSANGTFTYVTSLDAICATLVVKWDPIAGAYFANPERAGALPTRGAKLFAKFTRVCPDGEMVTGLSGRGYGGGAVSRFVVHCGRVGFTGDPASGWAASVQAGATLTSPVSGIYDTVFEGRCPDGQVGVGQHGGFYGNVIGGVGLVCGGAAVP